MIFKILLIIMFLIAVFMYLLLVGANKCKTAEERELEDREQIEKINDKDKCRRQNNDR